ncbi:hypothetical protein D3C81_1509800 [compost metagenome]
MLGRLEGFAAAVADDHPAAGLELVALGVAAEVVVVLDDQDARLRMLLAVEPGGRQPADAAADHHQVVLFLHLQAGGVECLLLPAHLVRHLEGARVAAAQAGEGGRVVTPAGSGTENLHRRKAGGDGESDAVEEVAAGDGHGGVLAR